jgi:VWFA-related protein
MLQRLVLIAVLLAAAMPAFPAEAEPVDAPRMTESISVGYVIVPFVALDKTGKPIDWLRHRDVTLLIDGAPVATDMFERVSDATVSFTILLDGSGSMGLAGKMDGARAALANLIRRSSKGDDFALYVFAEGEVEEVVPFTEKGLDILRAVEKVKPWGKTALYDALSRMPDQTILGRNGARAIVLLTDGLDNASTMSQAELTRVLEGVDVPVYPLGLMARESLENAPRTREERLQIDVLQEIADHSAGRLAVTADPLELQRAIAEIGKDLRSQYLVGFAPTGKGAIKYRRITLKLGGLVRSVRVRAGYKGTLPPLLSQRNKRQATK